MDFIVFKDKEDELTDKNDIFFNDKNKNNDVFSADMTFLTVDKKILQQKNYDKAYWNIIEKSIWEKKGKINTEDLLELIFGRNDGVSNLEDLFNLYNILEDLKQYKVSDKAFVNFIRHFCVLEEYLEHNNYRITGEINFIRFHLWKNNIHLVIYFKKDFLIDFFSYDEDKNNKDKLIYSMKGSFSSSSDLKKSYKIERLLSILDGGLDETKKMNNFSFISKINLENSEKKESLETKGSKRLISKK